MSPRLKQEGLLHADLFKVEGPLAESYNRALKNLTGLTSRQDEFHVDKRGDSPELEEELGQNYLQNGSAHRYTIIVSPNQQNSTLIHEEFSYDDAILDFIYENYLSSIGVITRVDALQGEFKDDIRSFEELTDLLAVKHIQTKLTTPSGFIAKAVELQEAIKALKEKPELLYANDSAHIHTMIDLVGQVGDIRSKPVSPISVDLAVNSFYTRLFNGAYVFRNLDQESVPIHRPGETPMRRDHFEEVEKTFVIYDEDSNDEYSNSKKVKFISLDDPKDIRNMLQKQGLAQYDSALINKRLTRLEDLHLISEGFDVAEMNDRERARALAESTGYLSNHYDSLRDVQRRIAKGHSIDKAANDAPEVVKSMLLTPTDSYPSATHVTQNLLTRLWPFDFEAMHKHNRRELEHRFKKSDELSQNYIIKTLKR